MLLCISSSAKLTQYISQKKNKPGFIRPIPHLEYDEMDIEHEFEPEEYESEHIVQASMEQVCQDCFGKIHIGNSIIKRAFGWCCYPTCTYRRRDAFFTPTKTNSDQASNGGKYSEEELRSFDDHEFTEEELREIDDAIRLASQTQIQIDDDLPSLDEPSDTCTGAFDALD